ncbi:MAG: cyclase family protein [Firmicutes bacterium]|nr:cyclase family protein [Bacillota bacterium]
MRKLVDLSHPFLNETPAYPGDEPTSLVQRCSVERDGYASFALRTGLHAGTHLDAPLHFIAGGKMVKDLPLDTLVGRGRLLDVRTESIIRYKSEYTRLVETGDIVLLWTNHDSKFGTADYYSEHPIAHGDLVDFFLERKVKMIGMDLPSPERPPFELHKRILGAGIPLIENLTNLGGLVGMGKFEILAFPLKIASEACPVRVVAREI